MAVPANLSGLCHSHTTLIRPFHSTLNKPNNHIHPIVISIKHRKISPCSRISAANSLSEQTSSASSTTTSFTSPPEIKWSRAHGYVEKRDPQAMVLEYLRSLGFETEELEGLQLPITVDVMKERVEFLQKLSLNMDDINEYPLMLACSVKRNMVPVLDYLQKLGVRKSALPEMLRRYPQVLHSSVVIDLQPVIKFLGGLDIKPHDIPRVIETFPELLGFKLEGTMSTSVGYLVSIGVNPRAIGSMLVQYPQILAMRVGRIIKPFVDYLETLGVQKRVLAGVLEKNPYVLGFGLEKQVKKNVESLLGFGVKKQVVGSIITQYPDILGLELEAKLMAQRGFLDANLEVGPDGFAKIVQKMPQVAAVSQEPVLKRIGLLEAWGFSRENIKNMVVACPHLLALNLDVMTLSFEYFRDEMKGSLQELVEFPAYFTYSLETRIKPRFGKLSKKGIKCSLAWFLNCTDQRFEERLQAEYIGIEEMEPSFNGDEPSEEPATADESFSEDEECEDYEESEDELDELASKRDLSL